MIVTLKENRHAVLGHQLMNRQFPTGSLLTELPLAPFIFSAPFVQIRAINTASPRSEHVMREDKFVFRLTLLQRLLQPPVLRVANGNSPPIAVLIPAVSARFFVQRIINTRR